MAKKQDESEVRSTKVREPTTWETVVMVSSFILFISFIIWVFFAQSTKIDMQCEFANWKELPENITWFSNMEMYPNYANCHVQGEGNIFKWMMQVSD